jgi:hypothetical protein
MKRIALFFLLLALGLIIVQPLQADTILYNFQGNLTYDPAFPGNGDPWGIGSSTATFNLRFTVSPPPMVTDVYTDYAKATYTGVDPILTITGTNFGGVYHPAVNFVIYNGFDSGNVLDGIRAIMNLTFNGNTSETVFEAAFPASFWSNSEVPPLPKLVSQSDTFFGGHDTDLLVYGPNVIYYWDPGGTVSSHVVPLPPSVFLLGSGLLGLAGWRRFRKG